jgi:hypothetical protein
MHQNELRPFTLSTAITTRRTQTRREPRRQTKASHLVNHHKTPQDASPPCSLQQQSACYEPMKQSNHKLSIPSNIHSLRDTSFKCHRDHQFRSKASLHVAHGPYSHSAPNNSMSHPLRGEHKMCSQMNHIPYEPNTYQQTHPLQFLTDEPSLALLSDEPHLILRSRVCLSEPHLQVAPSRITLRASNPLGNAPVHVLRRAIEPHPISALKRACTAPQSHLLRLNRNRVHIPLAMSSHA